MVKMGCQLGRRHSKRAEKKRAKIDPFDFLEMSKSHGKEKKVPGLEFPDGHRYRQGSCVDKEIDVILFSTGASAPWASR